MWFWEGELGKYVAILRPIKADDIDNYRLPTGGSMQVFTEDAQPVDTGIVEAAGIKIYRVPDKNPIGF